MGEMRNRLRIKEPLLWSLKHFLSFERNQGSIKLGPQCCRRGRLRGRWSDHERPYKPCKRAFDLKEFKSGGRVLSRESHTFWFEFSKDPRGWIESTATGQLNLPDNRCVCLCCRNYFFFNPKSQRSQEIKHKRYFHFRLVTSAHQRHP